MSKSSSSVAATRLISAANRLTPRLILPDLTMTALLGRVLDLGLVGGAQARGADDVHLAVLAASAAKATVAAGTVKSTMPSAFAISGAGIARQLDAVLADARRARRRPGRSAASRAPSSAPASVRSLCSAIAFTSVRPMRPPAPATISRISAMMSSRISGDGIARRRPKKRTTAAGRRSPRSRQIVVDALRHAQRFEPSWYSGE